MCTAKKQKIDKADPVAAAPPPAANASAPVLNEVGASGSESDLAAAAAKRKGKQSLINELALKNPTSRPQIGVNVPV